MIINKPKYNEPIQWAYDYYTISFSGVTFVETYTYYNAGVFSPSAKTYTGGAITGYRYLVYDDALKTTLLAVASVEA